MLENEPSPKELQLSTKHLYIKKTFPDVNEKVNSLEKVLSRDGIAFSLSQFSIDFLNDEILRLLQAYSNLSRSYDQVQSENESLRAKIQKCGKRQNSIYESRDRDNQISIRLKREYEIQVDRMKYDMEGRVNQLKREYEREYEKIKANCERVIADSHLKEEKAIREINELHRQVLNLRNVLEEKHRDSDTPKQEEINLVWQSYKEENLLLRSFILRYQDSQKKVTELESMRASQKEELEKVTSSMKHERVKSEEELGKQQDFYQRQISKLRQDYEDKLQQLKQNIAQQSPSQKAAKEIVQLRENLSQRKRRQLKLTQKVKSLEEQNQAICKENKILQDTTEALRDQLEQLTKRQHSRHSLPNIAQQFSGELSNSFGIQADFTENNKPSSEVCYNDSDVKREISLIREEIQKQNQELKGSIHYIEDTFKDFEMQKSELMRSLSEESHKRKQLQSELGSYREDIEKSMIQEAFMIEKQKCESFKVRIDELVDELKEKQYQLQLSQDKEVMQQKNYYQEVAQLASDVKKVKAQYSKRERKLRDEIMEELNLSNSEKIAIIESEHIKRQIEVKSKYETRISQLHDYVNTLKMQLQMKEEQSSVRHKNVENEIMKIEEANLSDKKGMSEEEFYNLKQYIDEIEKDNAELRESLNLYTGIQEQISALANNYSNILALTVKKSKGSQQSSIRSKSLFAKEKLNQLLRSEANQRQSAMENRSEVITLPDFSEKKDLPLNANCPNPLEGDHDQANGIQQGHQM